MRSINVSTEVFAVIWAARQPGEETEDDILRRVLGGKKPISKPKNAPSLERSGFHDRRYDVDFPEGFEIFRTYLGNAYRARATGGAWLLVNDGKRYGSLNELSQAIGTTTENAWFNWFFAAPDGQQKRVSDMRDPRTIHRRRVSRPAVDADGAMHY
jgi:hypothetical protein